jgi:hypothetical protein
MTDIDHEFTEDIVCPHCGHVHGDSWEWAAKRVIGTMGDVSLAVKSLTGCDA